MVTPNPISPGSMRPFDALDADWARLCWRHRRSSVVAGWARQKPTLASVVRLGDVILPAGVDRRPLLRRARSPGRCGRRAGGEGAAAATRTRPGTPGGPVALAARRHERGGLGR